MIPIIATPLTLSPSASKVPLPFTGSHTTPLLHKHPLPLAPNHRHKTPSTTAATPRSPSSSSISSNPSKLAAHSHAAPPLRSHGQPLLPSPIIVGAGPSGLAVAASLRGQGVPFVVLERENCIASLWQKRTYDRLKLHLPKQFCELPGKPFPADYPEYPTRGQFIDYLRTYAATFDVKPEFGRTVQSTRYDEISGLWRVHTSASGAGDMEYIGRWLVVATGENVQQAVPDIPGLSGFAGEVSHVSEYTSGEKYRGKSVLVVGCGNSGMEVSLDLCDHGALPSMVVHDAVHVLPRKVCGRSTFELATMLMAWFPLWFVDKIMVFLSWFILGNLAAFGIRRPAIGPLTLTNTNGRAPALDTGAMAKIRSGKIAVVAGVARFTKNSAVLTDGTALDVDAVVTATWYKSKVPQWLHNTDDFVGNDGYSKTAVPHGWISQTGLHFVAFTRRGLSGASANAVRIAKDLAQVWREETKPARRATGHRRCISVLV